MTTKNKCKTCGCDDSFMVSPAPCPTPVACPTPQPCSEIFDAQCVRYTGANILCDTDIVVNSNDTVAEALESIVDYVCNNIPVPVTSCPPKVKIERNSNGTLTATASGGTESFTFEWEFSSKVNGTSNMFGPPGTQVNTPTTSTFGFSRITTPGISPVQTNGNDMYIGLAKVIAIDTAGCTTIDTYLVIDLIANG
jgi:hypothetical protein